MRTLRATLLAALLVLLLPLAAQATDKGASLKYGGGGLGTVIFDGRMHAGKGYVCQDCHLDLFATKKQANVRMADHFTNQLCFKCHDNKEAPKDCITCHRVVPSSGLTYSPYMRDAMSRPLADEAERESLLTGRSGVSEQTRACLSCHSDPNLKPVSDRGKELNLYVQGPAYGASAHGALPCAACHFGLEGATSFVQQPHALARPNSVDCKSCHVERLATEVAAFGLSAHMKKTEGRFTCVSCHDVHDTRLKDQQPDYMTAALEFNKACLSCHNNPEKFATFSSTPLDLKGMEHSFMAKFEAHSEKVLCSDCHSPLGASGMGMDSHRILEKSEALRDCSSCHRGMDSLIISRVSLRDGNSDAFSGSYIPAFKAPGVLDRAGGWALLAVLGVIILHGAARLFGKKVQRQGELKAEYIYPLPIRVFHWLNALCFILLIWTGLGIRFEGLAFTPALELATRLHNCTAYVLIANFAAFLVYGLATGDIRQYLPKGPGVLGRIIIQLRYYLFGIYTGAKKPFGISRERRFNPLQQLTYLLVFILGLPVLILSGVLLLLPESVSSSLASRECLATVHYCLAIAYGLFLAAHIYLASTGESMFSLIKGMITGRHEHWGD